MDCLQKRKYINDTLINVIENSIIYDNIADDYLS